jgi:hypothetical protein
MKLRFPKELFEELQNHVHIPPCPPLDFQNSNILAGHKGRESKHDHYTKYDIWCHMIFDVIMVTLIFR